MKARWLRGATGPSCRVLGVLGVLGVLYASSP